MPSCARPAPTAVSTRSLHDARPICARSRRAPGPASARRRCGSRTGGGRAAAPRSEEHTSELQSRFDLVCRLVLAPRPPRSPLAPYTTLVRSALEVAERRVQRQHVGVADHELAAAGQLRLDRKSTRLNSSHVSISYAVLCSPRAHRGLHSLPTRRSSDLRSKSPSAGSSVST